MGSKLRAYQNYSLNDLSGWFQKKEGGFKIKRFG